LITGKLQIGGEVREKYFKIVKNDNDIKNRDIKKEKKKKRLLVLTTKVIYRIEELEKVIL